VERRNVTRTRHKPATLRLRLYVAGHAPNSVRAIDNATALCQAHFASTYDLEIVDVLQNPSRALADGILVTPTLIKLSSRPVLRVIGNLSDTQLVLVPLASR
jgi:circadian clock protein KaiB